MKPAVSNSVSETAEGLAWRLDMSRDQLCPESVSEHLGQHRNEQSTKKRDEIYAKEPSNLDPALDSLQIASLNEED